MLFVLFCFQVTNYSPTGLPLIQLWSVVGDEVSSVLLFLLSYWAAVMVDLELGSLLS